MLVTNFNQFLTIVFVLIYLASVHFGLFVFITLIVPVSIFGIRLLQGACANMQPKETPLLPIF